ncbi:hypothetical protein FSARC_7646 [Fusarium sarcochroum]|uniref:Uncharacterized protein n=1 Tax=Fusarium sarcochroum TaxID=1208366 RepID=A0A8H4X824_9HYPO|nr:hypothetical protein FSARC_7646 [Fusarium sarcochroum]
MVVSNLVYPSECLKDDDSVTSNMEWLMDSLEIDQFAAQVHRSNDSFKRVWLDVTADPDSGTSYVVGHITRTYGKSRKIPSELTLDQQEESINAIETKVDNGELSTLVYRQELMHYDDDQEGIFAQDVIKDIIRKGEQIGFPVKLEKYESTPHIPAAMYGAVLCRKYGYELPTDFIKNRTMDQFIHQVYEEFNPKHTIVHKWFPCLSLRNAV